jgi:hypothetical protein
MIGVAAKIVGTKRRAGSVAAAAAIAVAVAGCGANTASNTKGPRWLVKVKGNYANVYAYPDSNRPGTPEAVKLGLTFSTKELYAAAAKLGVPRSHVEAEIGT